MAIRNNVNHQFAAENSTDVLCRVDLNHVMRYVSPSCLPVLGWTPEEMTNTIAEVFVLEEDLPAAEAAIARTYTPGMENTLHTARVLRKNKPPAWMELNRQLVRDPETGEPLETILIMRDITGRKPS